MQYPVAESDFLVQEGYCHGCQDSNLDLYNSVSRTSSQEREREKTYRVWRLVQPPSSGGMTELKSLSGMESVRRLRRLPKEAGIWPES